MCALPLQYLCELSMVSGDPFLKYLPSEIAVSAVRLALHTLGRPSWVRLELCWCLVHCLIFLWSDLLVHFHGALLWAQS